MDEDDSFRCPSCGKKLSKRTIGKLRNVALGIGPANCDKCDRKLQWTKEVKDKIKVDVYIMNLGIVLTQISVIGWLGYLPTFGDNDHMLGVSIILLAGGSIVRKTKGAKLELSDKT